MTKQNCTSKKRNTQPKTMICGVAYNSKGKHKSREGGTNTKPYYTWRNMIRRCYNEAYQVSYPAYIGCSVSELWLDFQDFAEWYCNHEYSDRGFHLDKDILITGNKVYSPSTCCFIPQELNTLLTDRLRLMGDCPQGVNWCKQTCKYRAKMKTKGVTMHLGYFDCPNEAHNAYVEAKEAYVKEKAIEWKDRIEDRVFNALMAWRVES